MQLEILVKFLKSRQSCATLTSARRRNEVQLVSCREQMQQEAREGFRYQGSNFHHAGKKWQLLWIGWGIGMLMRAQELCGFRKTGCPNCKAIEHLSKGPMNVSTKAMQSRSRRPAAGHTILDPNLSIQQNIQLCWWFKNKGILSREHQHYLDQTVEMVSSSLH